MNKSFPIEEVDGKEYVLMKSDVFVSFFYEIIKYKNIDSVLIDEINKQYNSVKKNKRKRIRLKKEKEVLTVMYNVLFHHNRS